MGSGRVALAMRVPGQRLTAGPATDGAGGGGCAQSPRPLGWAGPPGDLVLPPRWTGACLLSQGAEGQKPGFGYGARASDYKPAHKGLKGRDAQSALSRIFRLVGGAGAGGLGRLGGCGRGQDVPGRAAPVGRPRLQAREPGRAGSVGSRNTSCVRQEGAGVACAPWWFPLQGGWPEKVPPSRWRLPATQRGRRSRPKGAPGGRWRE